MADDRIHDPNAWRTAGKWAFCGFLLVAAFFLITEHRAHFFGALPYLLLAACPLMHIFGHHHHHGGHEDAPKSDAPDGKAAPAEHHHH